MKRTIWPMLAIIAVVSGCTRVRPGNVYDDAGRIALRNPVAVQSSYNGIIRFDSDNRVKAYRIMLRRGQRLQIELQGEGAEIEIFEEIGPGDPIFRIVESSSDQKLAFEAHTDGPHVIRIHPANRKDLEIAVSLSTAAVLAFPVDGRDRSAVRSYFGDARDGGTRDHEGVDIFAPGGTPVHAVADGVITSVATTPIGGNVVWQEDPARGVSYYYAHLKSQSVKRGERVRAGDVIGTVGNTGNAKNGSPHLHFGVYRSGRLALDPMPYLFDTMPYSVKGSH